MKYEMSTFLRVMVVKTITKTPLAFILLEWQVLLNDLKNTAMNSDSYYVTMKWIKKQHIFFSQVWIQWVDTFHITCEDTFIFPILFISFSWNKLHTLCVQLYICNSIASSRPPAAQGTQTKSCQIMSFSPSLSQTTSSSH